MTRFWWEKTLVFKTSLVFLLVAYGQHAFAAGDAPLFSLDNTDFVVTLAFLAFIGILLYLKVPRIVGNFLDKRADAIKEEIDNANSILEESKSLLAKLEREHKHNIERAEKIILDAENEAKTLIEGSKKEIKKAIERKVKIAEEQIQATEEAVIRSIKDQAVDKSFSLAEKKIAEVNKSTTTSKLIENSISEIKSQI